VIVRVVVRVVAFPDDRDLVAALLARWRSMQLAETLSTPSSNHLIETLGIEARCS
jgi:hypothetical protein